MAVYVDKIGPTIRNKHWPYKQGCHMIADTESELHNFASMIGLQRAWHQHKPFSLSHYDLTVNKRRLAIKHGALLISQHGFVERLRKARTDEISRRTKQRGTI
jgi:hypothetical protein